MSKERSISTNARNLADAATQVLADMVNGETGIRGYKAEPATAAIPVIVLSADASRGVIRRLLAGGAFAYLTKPIELAELGGLLDTRAAGAQQRQPQLAIRIAPA